MPKTRFQKILPYKAEDLLAFASDIESYPEFINLVSDVRKTSKERRNGDKVSFDAQMLVKYKVISETVACRVDIDESENSIRAYKVDKGGPLKTLDNRWHFHTLESGHTLVDFYVEVSLKAFPLNMLLSQKFDRAAEHIMNVFMARAAHVCPRVRGTAPEMAVAQAQIGLT